MKINHPILVTNAIIFVMCSLFMGMFGWVGVGAVGVIQGVLNLFGGLVEAMLQKRERAKYLLLCGGVLLLIGFTLCSAFTLRL